MYLPSHLEPGQLFRFLHEGFLAVLHEERGEAGSVAMWKESYKWLDKMAADPALRDALTLAVLARLAAVEVELMEEQAPAGPSASFPA